MKRLIIHCARHYVEINHLDSWGNVTLDKVERELINLYFNYGILPQIGDKFLLEYGDQVKIHDRIFIANTVRFEVSVNEGE